MSVITHYLAQSYRRDILGESVVVDMPAPDPALIAQLEAELGRIDSLRLGAALANRNFVLAQHRTAMERLLAQLKAQPQQTQQEDVPPSEG
jgi:hypothetical protein